MPIFSYLCHAMNSIESRIIEFVQSVGTCTAAELLSYLNQTEEVRKTTLYWYLNKLTSGHRLSRVSRGLYSVSVRKDFIPEVTDDMIAANEILHRELPFSSFCLYKGTEFAPYLHNIATNNVLYVETERDSCESAFNVLKREGYTCYIRPGKEMIYHYINLADNLVFVKPLPSESPLQTVQGLSVPTLEKLLVDINVDEDFFYLQGSESFYILRNAAEKNVINRSRLLRYAKRRYVAEKLIKDLEEIGL